MIHEKIDNWDSNPLTNAFNKIIEMPQPEPKGEAFKMKIVPMYLCKSVYNGETQAIEDCTCGKCVEAHTPY